MLLSLKCPPSSIPVVEGVGLDRYQGAHRPSSGHTAQVSGLIPRAQLNSDGSITDPEAVFKVGQVRECLHACICVCVCWFLWIVSCTHGGFRTKGSLGARVCIDHAPSGSFTQQYILMPCLCAARSLPRPRCQRREEEPRSQPAARCQRRV